MTKEQILKVLEKAPDNAEIVIAEWYDDHTGCGHHYLRFNNMNGDLQEGNKTMDVHSQDGIIDRRPVMVLGYRDRCRAESADEYFKD